MIKMSGYNIILPRGDTGILQLGLSGIFDTDDRAIFAIYDILTRTELLKKYFKVNEYTWLDDNGDARISNYVDITIKNSDTDYLEAGEYYWDLRIVKNPIYDANGNIINGDEIDSLFASYGMPKFFLKEVSSYV